MHAEDGSGAAIAHRLEDAIQTGRPVTRLTKVGRWRIEAGGGEPIEADAVVLATPTGPMARILAEAAPAAVDPLARRAAGVEAGPAIPALPTAGLLESNLRVYPRSSFAAEVAGLCSLRWT